MGHSEQSPGSRQEPWQVRGNSSRILVGGTLDSQAIEWRGGWKVCLLAGVIRSRRCRVS